MHPAAWIASERIERKRFGEVPCPLVRDERARAVSAVELPVAYRVSGASPANPPAAGSLGLLGSGLTHDAHFTHASAGECDSSAWRRWPPCWLVREITNAPSGDAVTSIDVCGTVGPLSSPAPAVGREGGGGGGDGTMGTIATAATTSSAIIVDGSTVTTALGQGAAARWARRGRRILIRIRM